MPNASPTEPYFPQTLGGGVGYLEGNPLLSDPRDRDSPSPPRAILLRDYLVANPNFLAESSCSSLSLDSYSLGRLMSYPWEVSVANPLLGPFASVGMPSVRFESTQTQGGELCWQIFSSFWKQA